MLARQDACVVVLDRSFMNICSNALKARAADYEHMKQCTTVDRAYLVSFCYMQHAGSFALDRWPGYCC